MAGGSLARGPQSTAAIVGERAIISHADGVEQIDVLLDVSSPAAETGLVFPTPTPAKLSAGDIAQFDALESLIVPEATYVDDWWGFARSDSGDSQPQVLDTIQLGPLEATTLRATDRNGLRAWLRDNGFVVSAKTNRLFSHYIDKGWSFVAVKLTASEELTGALDPVRLTFESRDLVYPMRLSAASEEPQYLRLYVLGEKRMDVRLENSRRHLNAARETVWAGPVTNPQVAQRGSYLTVIDLEWDNPALQIVGDLEMVQLAAQDAVTPRDTIVVRTIALLGIPVGLLISGWLAIGLAIFFGALVARTRIR